MENVNRIEVIDETGRLLVLTNVKVQLSIQDDGKTAKLFVKKNAEFCAEPNCHTKIDETEIVCSLHKSLIEFDEFVAKALSQETAFVCDQNHKEFLCDCQED